MAKIPSLDWFALGYKFDTDREILAHVYINYFLLILFGIIIAVIHINPEELVPVSYRYHSVILLCILELWVLKKRWFTLARILKLSLLPFILLFLPALAGLFDNEFFFWFPYVPVGLSIIPHFILHTSRDRVSLVITLAAYLVITLVIDNYLIAMSNGEETIIPLVIENRFYYKLIPVFCYLFVNLALGLLFAKLYRYQEIMQKQQNDLIQAEKMASLGTLTAGIAHEMNNPLNFVSGSLNALDTLKEAYVAREEEITPEKKEILEKIDRIMETSHEGVKRATEVISDLNLFTRYSPSQRTVLDLSSLVNRTLDQFEKDLPAYISLRRNIPEGAFVEGLEPQLILVLEHILGNAQDAIEQQEKAGSESIVVNISSIRRDGILFHKASISNSGPLIPENELKQIYDPFFTSKEAGKGKGLGLSISYMVVRDHNGFIEAQNREGMVSVEVLLPAVQAG